MTAEVSGSGEPCAAVSVKKSAKVNAVRARLHSVSFSGSTTTPNYWELISDDAKTTFGVPQWRDDDYDGSAEGKRERLYPVAYTRNTAPLVKADLDVEGAPADGVTIKVKADGTDGVSLPETSIPFPGSMPATPCSSWPNTIRHYKKNFELKWQVQVTAGSTTLNYRSMSTSKNTVYVTLGNPATAARQETVFEFGCRNADGATAASGASDKIWAAFKGGVLRVDGVQMRYWNPKVGAYDAMEGMLADPIGDGTCTAWADFFKAVLEAQGVSGATRVYVTSKYRCDAGYTVDGLTERGGMLIKYWTFSYTGLAPERCRPFTHRLSDVTDKNGAPGQGNEDPPGIFTNHYIILYNSKYYDPSYGNGPFTSQAEWENFSVAGYDKIFAPAVSRASPIDAFKPDDPTIVETIFQ